MREVLQKPKTIAALLLIGIGGAALGSKTIVKNDKLRQAYLEESLVPGKVRMYRDVERTMFETHEEQGIVKPLCRTKLDDGRRSTAPISLYAEGLKKPILGYISVADLSTEQARSLDTCDGSQVRKAGPHYVFAESVETVSAPSR